MTQLFASLRGDADHPTRERPRARGDAAARRLTAAQATFDRSVLALRKAALDHVDLQDLASTALRANLHRLAERLGTGA